MTDIPLPAGTPAPDFTLVAHDGSQVRLAEVLRASRVLLCFYPGNNTPG